MYWEIPPPGQAAVDQPLTDFPAGLLYGYGVYTTFKLPLDEEWLIRHLERLAQNAEAIGLAWPYKPSELMQACLRHYRPEAPVCRLTALPQVGGYGDFYRSDTFHTRLILSYRDVNPPSAEGISLQTSRYERPFAAIKLNAMAELILLKRHARRDGFEDILLVNNQGHISEASTANIVFIRQGELITSHPERDHCLPGITRLRVLSTAAAQGIPYREQSIPADWLGVMDGAFLTNAAQGIIPVQRVDHHAFPWPKSARTVFNTLQASFR
jgi:branched-chain amino acid aminotransferase